MTLCCPEPPHLAEVRPRDMLAQLGTPCAPTKWQELRNKLTSLCLESHPDKCQNRVAVFRAAAQLRHDTSLALSRLPPSLTLLTPEQRQQFKSWGCCDEHLTDETSADRQFALLFSSSLANYSDLACPFTADFQTVSAFVSGAERKLPPKLRSWHPKDFTTLSFILLGKLPQHYGRNTRDLETNRRLCETIIALSVEQFLAAINYKRPCFSFAAPSSWV